MVPDSGFRKIGKMDAIQISDLKLHLSYHGHVDVGGVELHVDLLVDGSLGVGVEVLSNLGRHFESFS